MCFSILRTAVCVNERRSSPVGARCVDTHAFVVAQGGDGGALVGVVEAGGPAVAGGAGAEVAAGGWRAARPSVGAGPGQTAVLPLTPRAWPRQQG